MIFRHPINKLRGKWNERNERRSREPSREPSPVPSTAGTPPPPDQPARCELSATSQPTNEMNREQSPPFATPPIATPPIATPPVPSPQITITVVAETAVQYCNPRQMLEHTCALARERLTTKESQDIKTDEPSGDKAESAVEEIRSKIFPSQDSKTDEPSGDKAESAMEEIRRALDKKRSMEKNSKTQQRIVKILKIMDKYCTIVDVAIQHHPDITALVWAGVRTFLMVALNHYETLENLEEAMETITTTMAKSEFYCSIYASSILGSDGQSTKSHSKETTDALMGLASTLQKLYAAVIVVSVKARAYFQPSNFMVGLKNALNPFSTAFKDQLDEISKCEGVLHELANNAGLVNILENSDRLKRLQTHLHDLEDILKEKLSDISRGIEEVNVKLGQHIEESERENFKKCREWLGALESADLEFDQHRAKWMKGTCAWIRETDEYHALMDDRRRQHLWVHGQPGAGKSVLTSFVLKESRETMSTKSGCRIIHFFCKEGNPKTSSAAAIAANLVDQLVAKTPLKSFFDILKKTREKSNAATCSDFKTLWNIFTEMVREFPITGRILVILDALDECTIDRSDFMERLLSLTAEEPGKLRFFATSRREPDIAAVLDKHPHVSSLWMSADGDIKQFVIRRVNELPRLEKFKDTIIPEVTKHSGGMFRYAGLMIQELNSPSTTDIFEILKAPPNGLYEMYERIILRLDGNRRGPALRNRIAMRKRILQWVAFSKQPLKFEVMAYACATIDEEKCFDPSKKIMVTEDDMKDICGPLVEILKGKMQFTHLSVKEFLFQKEEDLYTRDNRITSCLVDERDAHASIAITCLTQLSGNINLDRKSMNESSPLYYAVNHWVLHATDVAIKPEETEKSLQLWDFVMRFLPYDAPKFKIQNTDFSDYQCKRCEDLMYRNVRTPYWRIHIASAYGLTSLVTRLIAEHECAGSATDISTVINLKDEYDQTPLFVASIMGHEAVVQLLLAQSDVDVNAKDDKDQTPLFVACISGQEALVQLLLARSDVDVNAKGVYGWTPIYAACRFGREAVVQLLLARSDVDVNAKDDGQTPLFMACRSGHEAVVQLLLARSDVDVNAKDDEGQTPLFMACRFGREAVVQLLLARSDVDVKAKANYGYTALSAASKLGRKEIVKLFEEDGRFRIVSRRHSQRRTGE